MDMDTDALRWLQQVADGTTVTEVSELEQVTQSGVSRALARLEAQLGTPLLRRSGRTLRLTHAGAVFKPHLDAMLHHLDDGIAAVSQLIDPDTGVVALAFQQSLGTWLVPDLVRSFRTAHGRVRFRLTQSRDEPDFVILDGGNADLELGTRRGPDETTRSRLIAVEPLRLAVRRDHPLARQALVQLAEAAGEPFVSLRSASGLRRQTDELCQRAGFRPDVIFEGDDLSNVRGFVAVGLGVAVLPAPRAGSPEAVPGPVAYLEIQDDEAARQIFLTWSAERRLLPATDLFRRHVIRRAAAGQLPAVALSNERGGVHAVPHPPVRPAGIPEAFPVPELDHLRRVYVPRPTSALVLASLARPLRFAYNARSDGATGDSPDHSRGGRGEVRRSEPHGRAARDDPRRPLRSADQGIPGRRDQLGFLPL
jgi:LysR family transcriptional regulator, transcription activator of glutamate synthase operon